MLPFIAIPTTAGTGSECQSYALVSHDETHEKMACGDPKALACIAILDPELTASQPHSVAILTALDALSHALESAVCTKRNPVSALYAESAFRHLASAVGRVVTGQPSADDRAAMLLGAALAGLAIENSMLGAAHASANPLTARHGIVHGHAVSLMLPAVMRLNATTPAAAALYAHFATLLPSPASNADDLISWLEQIISSSALPPVDARPFDVTALADDATRQWTGKFNPVPLQLADFTALYRRALPVA
jgi:alcohol dehydrogenase